MSREERGLRGDVDARHLRDRRWPQPSFLFPARGRVDARKDPRKEAQPCPSLYLPKAYCLLQRPHKCPAIPSYWASTSTVYMSPGWAPCRGRAVCTSPETSLMQSQPSESLSRENLRPREDGGVQGGTGTIYGVLFRDTPPRPCDLLKFHILSVTWGWQKHPGCPVSLPSFRDLLRDRA